MNKARKAELQEVAYLLEEAVSRLDEIRGEEQDAFDNLHPNFQYGTRGDAMQDAILWMDNVESEIYKVINTVYAFTSKK